MELKPGYKQTEVGVIPEDWEAVGLPALAWFQEGPGLRQWQFRTSGMKVINVTNLEDGFLNLDRTERHISLNEFESTYRHFAIDDGDIVMASSGNSYAKTALVRARDLPLVMNTSVIRFKPTKATDHSFLWALLTSPIFKAQIDLMITGGAQPNFGPYHLRKVLFPAPPLPEQRAIATALSEVDGLIRAQEQLIAKKRDLKQAAIQQLLTAQHRLPSFSGKWAMTKLGEFFAFKNGLNKAKEFFGHGTPIVNYMDVFKNSAIRCSTLEGRVSLTSQELKNFDVKKGDVLFTRTSETSEEIGMAAVIADEPRDTVFSGFVLRGRPKDERLCDAFKAYCFRAKFVRDQIISKASYTTRALTNGRVLSDVILPIPPLPEQTAIAEVLSDMDEELAALETRLAKTRALKQGMMQSLLTGRIRLI